MSLGDVIIADIEALGTDIENVGIRIWSGAIYPMIQSVGHEIMADALDLFHIEVGKVIEAGVDVVLGIPVGDLIGSMLNAARAQGRIDIANLHPTILNGLANMAVIAAAA